MKTLYIFGDSNTYGYDPADGWDARYKEEDIWTFRLQNALRDEWKVVADGQNGRQIPTTRYEENALFQRMDHHTPIDLFAVMLGTNDYLNMVKPDADLVAQRMKTFLSTLSAKIPPDRILVIAPPPAVVPAMFHAPGIDTSDGRLSAAYKAVAEEGGYGFLDTIPWDLKLAYDGVHLSEEAHHVFAEKMGEFIRGKESVL